MNCFFYHVVGPQADHDRDRPSAVTAGARGLPGTSVAPYGDAYGFSTIDLWSQIKLGTIREYSTWTELNLPPGYREADAFGERWTRSLGYRFAQ